MGLEILAAILGTCAHDQVQCQNSSCALESLSGISSFEGLIKERNLVIPSDNSRNLVIHSDNSGAEWAMRKGKTLARDCLHSDT